LISAYYHRICFEKTLIFGTTGLTACKIRYVACQGVQSHFVVLFKQPISGMHLT